MPETLSVAELRAHDICGGQLALFRATFGDEAEVTEANMTHAADVGLQIEWLARFIATVPALAEFAAARDQAQAVFEAARAEALAAHEAASTEQAWELYQAAGAQAVAAYRRALIGPLVRALRAEDGA
jgi:hypothetical protein